MTQTIVILGAHGRMGRNADLAFSAAGWTVRRYDRSASVPLAGAAQGADAIFNGWNPAYTEWAKQVPDLTANVIEAARASGATVLIPGNVYVFGRDMPDRLTPATPHRAHQGLGRIRVEMEATYRASGVPTILLRAGDFIDTTASGNWLDKMILAQVQKDRFVYPGPLDRVHAWAFLPDLAACFVRLAERRAALPTFTDLTYPGLAMTGQTLAEATERVLGRSLTIRQMNWLPVQLAKPVWPMGRKLLEMRYLWQTPHALDGAALTKILGEVPITPVDAALRPLLASLDRPK